MKLYRFDRRLDIILFEMFHFLTLLLKKRLVNI
jgi:hypothetical protein